MNKRNYLQVVVPMFIDESFEPAGRNELVLTWEELSAFCDVVSEFGQSFYSYETEFDSYIATQLVAAAKRALATADKPQKKTKQANAKAATVGPVTTKGFINAEPRKTSPSAQLTPFEADVCRRMIAFIEKYPRKRFSIMKRLS